MSAGARHIRTIMVPLDGSEFAEQALPTACAIADETGARIRLVLVHQRPDIPLDPTSAALYSSTELCMRKGEGSYLEAIRARLRQDGRVVPSGAQDLSGRLARDLSQPQA